MLDEAEEAKKKKSMASYHIDEARENALKGRGSAEFQRAEKEYIKSVMNKEMAGISDSLKNGRSSQMEPTVSSSS